MKKWIVLLACLVSLSLSACVMGAEEKNEDANIKPSETETQSTETQTNTEDLKALAESCIDKSVQELYALVGEPDSSEYVPSCLGSGEDGNLYYADFTVYTYREGDTETVRVIE